MKIKNIKDKFIHNIIHPERLGIGEIYIALNAQFFSYYLNQEIDIKDNFKYWIDGYYAKNLFKMNKIPGREILYYIRNKELIFISSRLTNSEKIRLLSICPNSKLIEIGYGKPDDLFKAIKDKIDSFICKDIVICIASPKQEILATLMNSNRNYKIYCLGGALNMLLGKEKTPPEFISNHGLEFIWRLLFANDRLRRLKRLYVIFIALFKFHIKNESIR